MPAVSVLQLRGAAAAPPVTPQNRISFGAWPRQQRALAVFSPAVFYFSLGPHNVVHQT